MRLLFLSLSGRNVTTRTGLTEPLGGTESAVCGLTKALAANGHDITIINGHNPAFESDGVKIIPMRQAVQLNDYDAVISVSACIGGDLRSKGCTKPIILWQHQATNQPMVQSLNMPSEVNAYTGFAFVSQWQEQQYKRSFDIKSNNIGIMRNAISAPFENVTRKPHEGITLAYTSTPYRGLDVLLLAFPLIRKSLPNARLRIFSGMGIYGMPDDDYAALYEVARHMEVVEYVGAVSQTTLAKELASVDIWAYPCTFEETSCVSAMEAMAAGCFVVSTDLGAMRETTREFGNLMPMKGEIAAVMAKRFAEHVIGSKIDRADINDQIEYARGMNWSVRAKEWELWLSALL